MVVPRGSSGNQTGFIDRLEQSHQIRNQNDHHAFSSQQSMGFNSELPQAYNHCPTSHGNFNMNTSYDFYNAQHNQEQQ